MVAVRGGGWSIKSKTPLGREEGAVVDISFLLFCLGDRAPLKAVGVHAMSS